MKAAIRSDCATRLAAVLVVLVGIALPLRAAAAVVTAQVQSGVDKA